MTLPQYIGGWTWLGNCVLRAVTYLQRHERGS
jgi:hypothetical protein